MNAMIGLGERIPSQMVRRVSAKGIEQVDSRLWLGKGTTILFAVPGAFTPTCHNDHLPGFVALAEKLADAGADRIVCASVNDHYVLDAWGRDRNALGVIDFLADYDAAFAQGMGLAKDMSAGGLGWRYRRTAMIVRDGEVEKLFVDDRPGVLTNTSASAILLSLHDQGALSSA